jgi:hypothetical protein
VRRILTIVLALLVLVIMVSLASCSKSVADQQRPGILNYLIAFNKIDNGLTQTSAQIFTASASSDLAQFSDALNQGVVAMTGVLQSVDTLKTPEIADVKTHLADYRQLIQDTIDILQAFKAAILSGNQSAISQAENDLGNISQRDSTINRTTEALMAKYNITDAQANYTNRGK